MCLVAQKMSGDPRSQGNRSNMVFGWSIYCRKSRVWYGMVCKHWSQCQAWHFLVCSPLSLLYHTLMYLHSNMTTRLLIFNCTSGCLGKEFLATILNTVDVQLWHPLKALTIIQKTSLIMSYFAPTWSMWTAVGSSQVSNFSYVQERPDYSKSLS